MSETLVTIRVMDETGDTCYEVSMSEAYDLVQKEMHKGGKWANLVLEDGSHKTFMSFSEFGADRTEVERNMTNVQEIVMSSALIGG